MHPGGQEVAQRVGSRGVGVLIAVHRHAAFTRRLDLAQQFRRTAPVIGARELEMGNLHVDATGLTYGNRFTHGVKNAVGLIADMR